jgi:cation-transporting ATPase 13A3/4/5
MASLHHEDDILELAELLQTGTLTEDGLDMWGVVPVADRKFQVPLKCVDKLDYNEEFLVGMVTCHSLTIIDGKLSGDPLDLKVSGWMTLADRPV